MLFSGFCALTQSLFRVSRQRTLSHTRNFATSANKSTAKGKRTKRVESSPAPAGRTDYQLHYKAIAAMKSYAPAAVDTMGADALASYGYNVEIERNNG